MIRDVKTGSKQTRRFRAAENVDRISFEKPISYQFLYIEEKDELLHLMHPETFDTVMLSSAILPPNASAFLKEGMNLDVLSYKEEALWIEFPPYMTFTITVRFF